MLVHQVTALVAVVASERQFCYFFDGIRIKSIVVIERRYGHCFFAICYKLLLLRLGGEALAAIIVTDNATLSTGTDMILLLQMLRRRRW